MKQIRFIESVRVFAYVGTAILMFQPLYGYELNHADGVEATTFVFGEGVLEKNAFEISSISAVMLFAALAFATILSLSALASRQPPDRRYRMTNKYITAIVAVLSVTILVIGQRPPYEEALSSKSTMSTIGHEWLLTRAGIALIAITIFGTVLAAIESLVIQRLR